MKPNQQTSTVLIFMKKLRLHFQTTHAQQQVLYIKRDTTVAAPKRLLLVHGAGVG